MKSPNLLINEFKRLNPIATEMDLAAHFTSWELVRMIRHFIRKQTKQKRSRKPTKKK